MRAQLGQADLREQPKRQLRRVPIRDDKVRFL